jgi:hypothetical protein
LYDYKNKNPGCTLLTEYILAEQEKWRFKWRWWQMDLL